MSLTFTEIYNSRATLTNIKRTKIELNQIHRLNGIVFTHIHMLAYAILKTRMHELRMP